MTALTIPALVLVLLGAWSRFGTGRALALAGATPMGAALVLGPTLAVPTFDFVAVFGTIGFALVSIDARRRTSGGRLHPAIGLLLIFAAWTTAVTIVAPLIFRGVMVLDSAAQPYVLGSTALLNTSNVAQLGYLYLGIVVVIIVARDPMAGPDIIGLTLGTTTVLSFWRLLATTFGFPFPEGLFDNSPAFSYVEGAPDGSPRFRGILSEPSLLAVISLATITFMALSAAQSRGWRPVAKISLLVLACINAIVSTSATFIVASLVLAAAAVLAFVLGFVSTRVRASPLLVVAACIGAIGLLWALPPLTDFVQSAIDAKVSSSSYTDRSGSDSFSYALTIQTLGIGVGIGNNRPSSFLAGILSTTGVVGAVLFFVAVVLIIRSAAPERSVRPVLWTLITLLICKFISSPDLGDATGLTWTCLGILLATTAPGGMIERKPLAEFSHLSIHSRLP